MFYLRHLLVMSRANRARAALIAIGIFVAVFLYASSSIFTVSYYEGQMRQVEETSATTVAVETFGEASDFFAMLDPGPHATAIDVRTALNPAAVFSELVAPGRYLTLSVTLHGVSSTAPVTPVALPNQVDAAVGRSLVKGRGISPADLVSSAPVVVIDQLSEELLFPDGDSLGKTVTLGVDVNGTAVGGGDDDGAPPPSLEVIGVVATDYSARLRHLTMLRELESGSENLHLTTAVYSPISYVVSEHEVSEDARLRLYVVESEDEVPGLARAVRAAAEASMNSGLVVDVTTKADLRRAITAELAQLRSVIDWLMALLSLVTGLSIMSTTFFAVKERVPEIGVRKAFGASKVDIAFQQILELAILAFVVSAFAVGAAVGVGTLAEDLLESRLHLPFALALSPDLLVVPVVVGVLMTSLFSLPPSIYAMNIKVTDALRFD